MDSARDVPAETTETPAAVADAEQHVRQEIAGIRTRMSARAAGAARPLAAVAGIVLSGWLIRRWRLRR
jgi:cell division septal protein FtsQ